MLVNEKIKAKVLIEELATMSVATYRVISQEPERDATLYMKERIRKSNLNFNNLRKFGVDIPVSETQQNIGLRGYECWICLPENVKNIEGTSVKIVPIGNYAVLRINNPTHCSIDTISNGWIELHNWVKMSGYKSALHNPNRYMLEELLKIEDEFYLYLYYPVSLY